MFLRDNGRERRAIFKETVLTQGHSEKELLYKSNQGEKDMDKLLWERGPEVRR